MTRVFWILLVAVTSSSQVHARTWHLQPDGTGDAPTIAAAINSSVAGDVVELACGTYHEEGMFVRSGITIRSETGQPECVTIEGRQPVNRPATIFNSLGSDDTTLLEGLTITGGLANDYFWGVVGGGLVISSGSSLVVKKCNIVGNVARGTGGVLIIQSHPTFIDCLIAENEATLSFPGGVTLANGSSLRAYNTTILSNIAVSRVVDGRVGPDCEVYFYCCDIDLAGWEFNGFYQVDDSSCGQVPAEIQSWGSVKAFYR
ncbi:MAG: hypothetical protein IPK64_18000 [bacterium]|nr:hypothetical protein [bacterium]